MARKIIIDCDPGIDDAVALTLALFDPRLEIVAITACSGTVDAIRSTQNLQAIVERLDPPRHPRLGAATDPENAPVIGRCYLHGEDGLGNINMTPVGRQHVMPSEKLIADRLKAEPGQISILCLGPLTGVSLAFRRDPSLIDMVDRLIIVGGTCDGIGDVTPATEFNMHFDPSSASNIFRSATTKTMIPLEVSNQVSFGLDLIEQLPPRHSRAGALLHAILPHYFWTLRQECAQEMISLQAVVGVLALVEPTLFTTQEATIEIEELGVLTRGATIIDRRPYARQRKNIELVTAVDVEEARQSVIRGLRFAGQESE
ncbi:MAG: nucleoside hydrolase [Pirellulaceae bacterium]|nr:nucleoside hydrolase [Pirellulaceae bacterium]